MKKKIGFFIKSLGVGGTERVLIAYLKGLVKSGKYDIELIVNRDSIENELLDDVPKEIPIKYILNKKTDEFIEKISKNRKSNLLYRLFYSIVIPLSKCFREMKVKRIIKENKIDIIIDFERSFIKCIEKFDCKKVLWNHFTFSNIDKKMQKIWSKRFDKYDKIVAISNEMLEEIEGFYSKIDKLEMLYNPQSFDKIEEGSLKSKGLSEEELNFLKQDYILYVGRIEKIKGLEDLINSYSRLDKEVIKEKLFIIGTGSETDKLKKLTKDLNLDGRVKFLGNKSNPYIWMKNAKCFVTTTYGEGLPTTYIESMICGTPVLSYDCPTGPKDILGMGKYGALIKMGDVDAFTVKLKELLNNDDELNKYRLLMKEKLDEFRIENIVDKFEKMIESMD